MKLRLHPFFLAVGIFCAVFGGLPLFCIFALTALLHECGHIFCAGRLGYNCQKVSLMPYGASAVIDIEGISAADEVKLALAGPLVNAAICVFVAGLWWFYPETYAYTDTVMLANASMLAINLLPAYPLDGGRVARRVLQKFLSDRAADIAMRISAGLVAAVFLALFFALGFNVSCLFLSAFMLCSAFEKRGKAIKINFSRGEKLKRGQEVKYVLADGDVTYKSALKHLDDSRYLVLQINLPDGSLEELSQDEIYERLQTHSLYDRIIE